jgi:hypothetical protein
VCACYIARDINADDLQACSLAVQCVALMERNTRRTVYVQGGGG